MDSEKLVSTFNSIISMEDGPTPAEGSTTAQMNSRMKYELESRHFRGAAPETIVYPY